MKIYTKTGDDGTTGLFSGKRVSKASLRVETYGTVDELNSVIGLAVSFNPPDKLRKDLQYISNFLFTAGSDLATPRDPKPKFSAMRIQKENIDWLENAIDEYDSELPELKSFILPGGGQPAAYLHLGRTICRRAERLAVALAAEEDLGEHVVKFLNRLSDYLFTAARYANQLMGHEDIKWSK